MTVQAEGKHPETSEHLDELALDAIRVGEGSGRDAEHYAGCALCQNRLRLLSDLEVALSAPPPAIEVPREHDEAILALTREVGDRVARRRFTRRVLPVALVASVAAAAIVFLILRAAPHRSGPSYAAGDLNHDRRVDILDAFAIARALDRGQAPPPDYDVNHDRVIDRRDVEAAARAAVALGGRL